MARNAGSAREETLTTRLASLLDALFEAHTDPYALYRGIMTQLRPAQLAAAQKNIKKHLQQRGEIGPTAAMLVGCVLYRTGFPPHRILHFLSLYVRGTVTLSLFELVVGAIFGDSPPLPASLLYDLTQYTYLEKRLLVRKGMEISEKLKDALNPGMLLYLYLLSLRDDLSNENVQLIALIMKNCFPALEVRTRLGGATLEEYGEIARAWRKAEQRSLVAERARAGAARRTPEAFDRDSASFFLDKYFSDAALEKMRASAPVTTVPIPRPRAEKKAQPPVAHATAPSLTIEPASSARRESAPRRAAPPAPVSAPAHRDSGSLTLGDSPLAATPVPTPHAFDPRVSKRDPGRIAPSETRSPFSAGASHEQRPPTPTRRAQGDWPRRSAEAPRQRARQADPPRAKPASSARPRRPSVTRPWQRVRVPAPRLSWIPALSAAVIVAGALLAARSTAWPPVPAAPSQTPAQTSASPPTAPATPGATAPSAPAQEAAPTVTYVVKQGDSLWRIFSSLNAGSFEQKGWIDFLSNTQKLNDLQNPDNIHPGFTLTLTPPSGR